MTGDAAAQRQAAQFRPVGATKEAYRQAIQKAALELFAERGYRETTINDIAERADVAPRTVTVYFPAKEELLLDAEPFTLDSLSKRLAAREPGESALHALRDWMATTMAEAETNGSGLDRRFWERRALRAQIINTEPELRGRARAGYYPFERVLAEAIGRPRPVRKQPDPASCGIVCRSRLARALRERRSPGPSSPPRPPG